MSRKTGFRRKWNRWQPSPAQRRVLDGLVEGKTNAAIAAELAIAPETVKWHVSELIGETGLADRQDLARWWADERRRPAGAFAVPHLLSLRASRLMPITAGLIVLATAAFLLIDRAGPEGVDELAGLDIGLASVPEALIEANEAPESCDPPEQNDLRLVQPEELRAEGLTRVGRLITPLHCPIYAANRSDRAFAWLGGEGVVDLAGLDGWQFAGASEVGLSFQQGAGTAHLKYLELIAVGLRGSLAEPGVNVDEAQGLAVTRRTHDQGAYLLVALQDRGFRRVALASTGELFVDEGEVVAAMVVNQETGEIIDTSSMIELGRLPVGEGAVTECRGGGPCLAKVTIRNAVVPSPVAGHLTCPEAVHAVPGVRVFELDSDDVVLQFRSIDPNAVPRFGPGAGAPTPAMTSEVWVCEERTLIAGEALPVHEDIALLEITARATRGTSLSAVAAYDGTLYVGEVTLAHPCGLLEYC